MNRMPMILPILPRLSKLDKALTGWIGYDENMQFSMKRIFASAALVAVGCDLLISFLQISDDGPGQGWLILPMCFGPGPLIGAGILNLVKRPGVGVFAGLLIQVAATPFWTVRDG